MSKLSPQFPLKAHVYMYISLFLLYMYMLYVHIITLFEKLHMTCVYMCWVFLVANYLWIRWCENLVSRWKCPLSPFPIALKSLVLSFLTASFEVECAFSPCLFCLCVGPGLHGKATSSLALLFRNEVVLIAVFKCYFIVLELYLWPQKLWSFGWGCQGAG